MNIQYSKWNKNEMKILNNSLRNILDIKEPQLYFPIMSLFFYIHNTPNSHRLIDFKRNNYIKEILSIENSNCFSNFFGSQVSSESKKAIHFDVLSMIPLFLAALTPLFFSVK